MEELEKEGEKKVYDEHLFKEIFFFETENINQRTDWFLIFHAILIEAYFSIEKITQKTILGYLGLLIAVLWLMSGIRTFKLLWQAGKSLNSKEIVGERMSNTFRKIFADRRASINNKFYGWARPAPLFSIITPVIILITWITILSFELSLIQMMILIAIVAVLVLIIAISANYIEESQHETGANKNDAIK